MWRYVVGLAVMSLVSFKGIEKYAEYRGYTIDGSQPHQSIQDDRLATLTSGQSESETVSYAGRTAKIKMDQRGHFVTTAKVKDYRLTPVASF